jgi:hypothetical protein
MINAKPKLTQIQRDSTDIITFLESKKKDPDGGDARVKKLTQKDHLPNERFK